MELTPTAQAFSRLAKRLDPDKLYAVSTLVTLAEKENLLPKNPKDTESDRTLIAKRRLFIHINRLIGLHPEIFPGSDGQIVIDGQAPLDGFKGRRYQEAAARVIKGAWEQLESGTQVEEDKPS